MVPPTPITPGIVAGGETQASEPRLPAEATRTTPSAGRVVERFVDARHPLAAAEVEAHVDHVGVVVDREADALGDVVGAAAAEAVEHPDRHQLRPVGEPGQADAVVGLLGDRAGDVGAVPVASSGRLAVADEVVALDELAAA